MDGFIERLIKEKEELKEKVEKLKEELLKDNFIDIVGEYQFNLLHKQLGCMTIYLDILNTRIIDLSKKPD